MKNMLFSKKYKLFDRLFSFKCKPITQNDFPSNSSILEGRGKIPANSKNDVRMAFVSFQSISKKEA